MHIREAGRYAVLILLLPFFFGGGCKKAGDSESTSGQKSEALKSPGVQAPVVAWIHWLGKKQIAAETNAAFLMLIWALPESQALETQTLDRLASAPWRLLLKGAGTNAQAALGVTPLLRPLLDDLMGEESYLELRQDATNPSALVLAIRLSNNRARLWETNLAKVLETFAGGHAIKGKEGWSLGSQGFFKHFDFSEAGDWTLIGMAGAENSLLQDVKSRIQRSHSPFGDPVSNAWASAEIDLSKAVKALGWGMKVPAGFPRIWVSATGDGQNVRTRGSFTFSNALPVELEGWNIPTNLVRDPLSSFTAVRGFRWWLEPLTGLKQLGVTDYPNQLFTWSLQGVPYQTFFALPISGSSNVIGQLTGRIEEANAWLSTNGMGTVTASTNGAGVEWVGVPFMAPYVRLCDQPGGGFVCGGFFPVGPTNQPAPAELLQEVYKGTNLVYYDWELTAPRIGGWVDIGQLLRIAFLKPQLPAGSASVRFLLAIGPKMGNCGTEIRMVGPGEFGVVRTSTVGFSGLELHLMADWLESPQFPGGLYSLLGKATLHNPLRLRAPGGAPIDQNQPK